MIKMNLEYYRCLLSGLLLLAFLSSGFAKPESGHDYPNDDDYQYDENIPSSSQDKSTVSSLRSTVPPYFVDTDYTKQVKPGDNAVLECFARNMADNNIVLWYKEKMIITQGSKVLNPRYQLEPTNHTLTIPKALENDSGDYVCNILPQNLTLHAKLQVTNSSNEYKPAEAQSSSSAFRLSLLTQFTCGALLTFLSLSYLDKFLRI